MDYERESTPHGTEVHWQPEYEDVDDYIFDDPEPDTHEPEDLDPDYIPF